jgi:hypothetical protein
MFAGLTIQPISDEAECNLSMLVELNSQYRSVGPSRGNRLPRP